MWVIGIVFNILALRFLQAGIIVLSVIIFILDIFVILPEIHLWYIIENKCLIVKRILYPDKVIPCNTITLTENAALLTVAGFALKIMENSLSGYKITYHDKNHLLRAAVISPKDRRQFMSELALYLDREVIAPNNSESAFKRKKDE